jgi:hypothetical protein
MSTENKEAVKELAEIIRNEVFNCFKDGVLQDVYAEAGAQAILAANYRKTTGVEVKPLKWKKRKFEESWSAKSPFHIYEIIDCNGHFDLIIDDEIHSAWTALNRTMEAANTHHRELVMQCIVQKGGENELE